MDANTFLVIAGAVLLSVGIIGGGFSVRELAVPPISTTPRVLAFLTGALLIALGVNAFPLPNRLTPAAPDAKTNRDTINLAQFGSAVQSTTHPAYDAGPERAIDGNRSGDFFRDASVTHTEDKPGSFWELTLARTSSIESIVIFNRSDCCGSRLSNFTTMVLDERRNPLFTQKIDSIATGGKYDISLPRRTSGRIVRIQLDGKNRFNDWVLSLAEVEVYGH